MPIPIQNTFPESNAVHRSLNYLKAERAFNKFTTIVAADGSGDYTLLSTAVAAGAKSIWIKSGDYAESADLTLSGVTVRGENAKDVRITFTNSTLTLDQEAPEAGGTITLTNNSQVITGAGTTFTNVAGTNPWIYVEGMLLEIQSITNDSELILKYAYQGPTTAGLSFHLFDAPQQMNLIEDVTLIQSITDEVSRVFIVMFGVGNKLNHCYILGSGFNSTNLINAPSSNPSYGAWITNCIISGGEYGIFGVFKAVNIIDNQIISHFSGGIALFTGSSNPRIIGNLVAGSTTGITIEDSAENAIIDSNQVRNMVAEGITSASARSTVSNNIIENTARAAAILLGQPHSKAIGNTIKGCKGIGISMINDYQTATGNHIVDQTIGSGSGAGISLNTNNHCIVSENLIENPEEEGIELLSANQSIISSNVIRSAGLVGVHLTSANNIIISANQILEGATNGIFADSNSQYANITSNQIASNSNTGIISEGGQAVIVGNNISSNGANGIDQTGDEFTISGNGSYSNTGTGILIEVGADNGAVVGNTSKSNAVQLNNLGAGNTVADNEV